MNNHTVSQTRETLVKDIGKLKEDANQVALDVKTHANAHVDEARQRFTDTYGATKEYISTHPLSLLGAGFVVGLLFGLRLRR